MRRSKSAGGWLCVCVLVVLIPAATASPARAQGSTDPNPGALAVPVKVGLSLNDYYEGIGGDDTFGFLSVAGAVTVPFTSTPTRFGSWNIHGGVEFLMLGDRNEAVFGDSSHVIGSIGIGLSY